MTARGKGANGSAFSRLGRRPQVLAIALAWPGVAMARQRPPSLEPPALSASSIERARNQELEREVQEQAIGRSRLLWWLMQPREEPEHRALPLPIISTEPGVGFTAGVLGRYIYRRPEDRLSRVQLDVSAWGSVNGVQEYAVRTVLRDLLGGNEVIDLNFEALIDPVFSYVGLANANRLDNDFILTPRFEADRFSIGPDLNVQFALLNVPGERLWSGVPGVFRGLVGYRFEYDRFAAEPDSLLAEDWPEVLGEERRAVLYAGLSWDSRNNDYAPQHGGLHDVSVDTAGEWTGATRRFTRVGVSLRQYQRLFTDRVVLAALFRGDFIFGDVPLVPKGEFSGLVYREGIGGLYTGRGFVRRRFQGDIKVYGSIELRWEVFDLSLIRWTLTPGLRAFVDAGRAWDPRGDPGGAGGVSGGIGVFFVWDKFEVLRAELGYSPEGTSLVLTAQQSF